MKQKSYYLRIFLILECVLLIFLGIFYFSAGRTLYERTSDGDIAEFAATNDVGELTQGTEVAQVYTSQMDVLDSVGVMVSNYGKTLDAGVQIKCENLTTGNIIAENTFASDALGVNQYVYLTVENGAKVARGDTIKITCTSQANAGNAPTVLYNVENMIEKAEVAKDAAFSINGDVVPGTMCIAVNGRNYVWTGPNYWKLVLVAAVFLAVVYGIVCFRDYKGKQTLLFSLMFVFKKYKFLIKQLVKRDFKVRYKRSVLGVFWSFLNPLLMMIVQYVVFSQLFKSDIDNYPVYLLSGTVIFNFFNEGVGLALTSIVGNASLITKVYIPKYIYPVTRVFSSGINLLMSLIPLTIAALITGESVTRAYLMLPYILICVMIFTIGFGMALAAGMTFFRDVQFLWGVLSMLWMYLTPLFYPISIVPQQVRWFVLNNPMYYFVNAFRTIILEGVTPRPIVFCQCTVVALVMLTIGSLIFKKTQDKFIFYI